MLYAPFADTPEAALEVELDIASLGDIAFDEAFLEVVEADYFLTDTDYIAAWTEQATVKFGDSVSKIKVMKDGQFLYGEAIHRPPSIHEVRALNILTYCRDRFIPKRLLGALSLRSLVGVDQVAREVTGFLERVKIDGLKPIITEQRNGLMLLPQVIIENSDQRLRRRAPRPR